MTEILKLPVTAASIGAIPEPASVAAGDIPYYNGSNYRWLNIGNPGETIQAVGGIPAYTSAAPLKRYSIGADSQLTGDGMGATTETAHTAINLVSADLNTARRMVRFDGSLYADSDNGTDTWTARLRLGGVSGTLFASLGTWDLAAGDWLTFSGWIQIRTTGATGVFDAFVDSFNTTTGLPTRNHFAGVASDIDTTGSNDLVLTGESSSASADQQATLRSFNAFVWEA